MIKPIALIGMTATTLLAVGAMKAAPNEKPEPRHGGGTVIVRFFHDGNREKRLIEIPRAEENTNEQNTDDTIRFSESTENGEATPAPKKPDIKHTHKMRAKTLEYNNDSNNDYNNGDINNIAPQNITPEDSGAITPDSEYARKKGILDERFSHMFNLKAELDEKSKYEEQKWNEYNALNNAYQRELKRLVAEWVTDLHYSESV